MDLIQIAKELISFNTEGPPAKEFPLAKWIRDFLKDLGAVSELQIVAPERANVVARLGDGGGPGLLLSGHIDVVLAGDPDLWTVTAPFQPVVRNGKLFGRGSSDMKGGDACILDAVRELRKEDFKRQLNVVFTSGEDTGGWFVTEVVRQGRVTPRDAFCGLIPEPTLMNIVRCHKGAGGCDVIVHGKAAHSSVPEFGVNAIMKAASFLEALKGLQEDLRDDPYPLLGPTTVESTLIKGGFKSNIIPDRCEIHLNWRTTPPHSSVEKIGSMLEAVIRGCTQADPAFKADVSNLTASPPLDVPESDPLVVLLRNMLMKEPIGAPYYTEAVTYTQGGIPTVICGPGGAEQAHTPDEYITLEQLKEGKALIKETIERICL